MIDLELFRNDKNTLTSFESDLLNKCESIIQKGITAFEDTWIALLDIRDNRLYRTEFKTFEEYCQNKWGMGRSYINRNIRAVKTLETLVPIGTKLETESQLRPLTTIEPELRPSIVKQAFEISDKPTALIISDLVKKSGGLNEILKELKINPEFTFNSADEMLEKARELLPVPEPVTVIKEIRTLSKDDGSIWFVGLDVCKVLELKSVSKALARLEVDEVNSILITDSLGRNQETNIISLQI